MTGIGFLHLDQATAADETQSRSINRNERGLLEGFLFVKGKFPTELAVYIWLIPVRFEMSLRGFDRGPRFSFDIVLLSVNLTHRFFYRLHPKLEIAPDTRDTLYRLIDIAKEAWENIRP